MKRILFILVLFLGTIGFAKTYYYGENQVLVGTFNTKEIYIGEDEGPAYLSGTTIKPYFLFLRQPITVLPGKESDEDFDTPEYNVREIQLVLDEKQINSLRRAYGKRVRLTGSLFHSHTWNHHADVLMSVDKIEILN